MSDRYLKPVKGGRWAIGKTIGERSVHLIQNTPVHDIEDIRVAFGYVRVEYTEKNLDAFFPIKKTIWGTGRAPTLDFLERFATYNGSIATVHGV
jgi:hypothetical protein